MLLITTIRLSTTLKAVVPIANSSVMRKRRMKVMAVFLMLSSSGSTVLSNLVTTSRSNAETYFS